MFILKPLLTVIRLKSPSIIAVAISPHSLIVGTSVTGGGKLQAATFSQFVSIPKNSRFGGTEQLCGVVIEQSPSASTQHPVPGISVGGGVPVGVGVGVGGGSVGGGSVGGGSVGGGSVGGGSVGGGSVGGGGKV